MGMDVGFAHLSWWLWNGKHEEQRNSKGSTINSSADSVMWELNGLEFPLVMKANVPSSSERVKHKLHTREIDSEYDLVMVQSDWSIGWLEPHGTGFSNDDDELHETDNSFAVLVPCYGCKYGAMGKKENTKSNLLNNFECFPNSYSYGKRRSLDDIYESL